MDNKLPEARDPEKKLRMLWKRKGETGGAGEARQVIIRALPALLMLVLGLEALRIGTMIIMGNNPGRLLFLFPLRTLGFLEALGAVLLGLLALGRGFQIVLNQVLRGMPTCVVLMDREVLVYTDGLAGRKPGQDHDQPLVAGGVEDPDSEPESMHPGSKPGFTFSLDALRRLEIVPRRRREFPYELRAWGAGPFSRVIAVSDNGRDLEELRYKLQNPSI